MSRTTDRLGQIKARNDFMLKTWKYGVAGASRKTADLIHEDDVPGMLGALRNVLAECDDVERRQGTDAATVSTATIRRRIEESLIVGQR